MYFVSITFNSKNTKMLTKKKIKTKFKILTKRTKNIVAQRISIPKFVHILAQKSIMHSTKNCYPNTKFVIT